MLKKLVMATTNSGKLRELRALLPRVTVLSAAEAGFSEDVEETGTTFLENALLKARTVCRVTGLPTLGDDSGLCVTALDGAPGIYSARYSGQGMVANRQLLLRNLQGVTDRRAHFVCAMALVLPDGREFSALGETHGVILEAERGSNGFGYDCLFLSDDLGMSFAEAEPIAKNAVSHRGRALAQMIPILEKLSE